MSTERLSSLGLTLPVATLDRVRRLLPQGGSLPIEDWRRRHGGILALLWLNVLALPLYRIASGDAGLVPAFDNAAAVRVFAGPGARGGGLIREAGPPARPPPRGAPKQPPRPTPPGGRGTRRKLMVDLDQVLVSGESAVLVILDLDGFKAYNDTFGHPAGDSLLA